MTVKELIEKLNQLPQDLEVYSEADYDFVDGVYVDKYGDKDVVIIE